MVDISEYFQTLKFEIKALLFDWGNTVMKVLPEQNGPMASWSRVVTVEGIKETLPLLKDKYQIVLVSNAQDSDRALVRQALERVDLARYFDEIFTPQELKECKPAPNFYLNILKQIGAKPENAIMIGDDYENDIIAAKQVGLWTIWYNVDQKLLQNDGFPYHDAEIADIREVASVIREKLNLR
ncbi:MAG: HAD family hydrolase [bacterium]|nr:MAG: HAD family hydrolase [bacterium]